MGKSSEPKIFVSVGERTLQEVEQTVSNFNNSSLGLELRLDYLEDTHDLDQSLKELINRFRFPRVLATCRRTNAGGKFAGTIEEQLEVLQKAVRAGCQIVDVELESVKSKKPQELQRLFRPARLIVSYHNYRRSPPLDTVYRRLVRSGASIIKIATRARDLRDNLKIFRLLRSHRRRQPRLIALAMGPAGIPSRILGLQKGSHLTYASANSRGGVSPGQVAAEIMRASYRVEHLNDKTQLYGIVGSHASLSLSPIMHNAALHAKRINAVYLPYEAQRLGDFIEVVKALGLQGFSVTMPFKREIFKHLDWVDPLAERIGAVNTVAVRRGKWFGWNTDAAAVTEVLSKRIRLSGSQVLVLGAGGAARAAAYALQAEGAKVFISARRHSAAVRLARAIRAQALQWETPDWLETDSVINATPVGMPPFEHLTPTDLGRLRTRVVFDMVYHPIETRLMAEARRRGLVAISGLEMLVAQGARQFEIWTSETAPRALMEQAARQGLTHLHST
ncbi:MAG: shikimate dehydrogenase [Acidobacteria bacterium]|nr:shikimate dehydrogenase [Acidobacteriota bacterium]